MTNSVSYVVQNTFSIFAKYIYICTKFTSILTNYIFYSHKINFYILLFLPGWILQLCLFQMTDHLYLWWKDNDYSCHLYHFDPHQGVDHHHHHYLLNLPVSSVERSISHQELEHHHNHIHRHQHNDYHDYHQLNRGHPHHNHLL